MAEPEFGGPWTEEKLSRLRKYLRAYMTIFSTHPQAKQLKTVYVDAFAGAGFRKDAVFQAGEANLLFDVTADSDAEALRKGSARVALETNPAFSQYIFIENNEGHVRSLSSLRQQFPAIESRIDIVPEDANSYLLEWCRRSDWRETRAVVFLDPYGMQVEWSTISAMAETKAIDLWILFPLGVGVNRLLMRKSPPIGAWADRLTRIFGTDGWKSAFYHESTQSDLFNERPDIIKDADFETIAMFWVERLKTIFAGVARNPLPLRNSRNVPIYLLSFAAANPRGSKTAVKIAQDVLSR
jgi:three-Cys-motif partner protein